MTKAVWIYDDSNKEIHEIRSYKTIFESFRDDQIDDLIISRIENIKVVRIDIRIVYNEVQFLQKDIINIKIIVLLWSRDIKRRLFDTLTLIA